VLSLTVHLLSNLDKTKTHFKKWKETWGIKKVSLSGLIEFSDKQINYRETLFNVIEDLEKTLDDQIILFLDEFPDVIKNISEKEGADKARQLLDDLRAIRSNDKFNKVFTLVLLGSVGLNHIVKKVTGRTDTVNDLHIIYLEQLEKEQVQDFFIHMLKGATMKVSQICKETIVQKVGRVPYFIQLLIEECNAQLRKEKRSDLTTQDINVSFDKLVKRNEKFEDWDNRLTQYFPTKAPFLIHILRDIAHEDGLTIQEIYNIANSDEYKHGLNFKKDIDDILLADGYIHEENNNYNFNSPILKAWWKNRYPKFAK